MRVQYTGHVRQTGVYKIPFPPQGGGTKSKTQEGRKGRKKGRGRKRKRRRKREKGKENGKEKGREKEEGKGRGKRAREKGKEKKKVKEKGQGICGKKGIVGKGERYGGGREGRILVGKEIGREEEK